MLPLTDAKDRVIQNVSWFPILPGTAKVQRVERMAPGGGTGKTHVFVVDVTDVPPTPQEEYQPPMRSYSYRVLFNFSPYKSADEYWKEEGKNWSKAVDSFASPNAAVKAAAEQAIAGSTTPEEKLRKIYAAVMALENTRFTREHDKREDKAEGSDKTKSAADVLAHGRGSSAQLTELFVGMARSARLKAYAAIVPDRSIEAFSPQWLSFAQFNDLIAIVNLDGKDVFFDPGWRYTPFGHLAWEHTFVHGLRQTDSGTDFTQTTGDLAKDNRVTRVANLSANDHGEVTGKIDMTYMGSSAVSWRHSALLGDNASLQNELRQSMERMLPKSLEVSVDGIENLQEYEKPLVITFKVEGKLGAVTGKRIVMPADLFLVGASATFPHEKRKQAVYFHYPHATQDAVRVNLPKGFTVEAAPVTAKLDLPARESYAMDVAVDSSGFTTRRNYLRTEVLVPVKDYEDLRKFYLQFETEDQENVVIKTPTAVVPQGE
jgi:hypothetical protein